ncbi:MAG: hypothetical protein GXP25_09830 [Planctomycetes bacterium]|nr:hypothetical protein [Planctomycetota bacterium]
MHEVFLLCLRFWGRLGAPFRAYVSWSPDNSAPEEFVRQGLGVFRGVPSIEMNFAGTRELPHGWHTLEVNDKASQQTESQNGVSFKILPVTYRIIGCLFLQVYAFINHPMADTMGAAIQP